MPEIPRRPDDEAPGCLSVGSTESACRKGSWDGQVREHRARGTAYVGNSLTSALVTGEQTWTGWLSANPPVAWTIGVAVLAAAIWIFWVWSKGRPFAKGDVFRASRLSAGNHLFPTQVLITPTSVVQYTPRWIGRQEESIHMTHVASVKVATHILLSDVLIETTGGADPIRCHGHRKGDAVQMKALIERYQNEYYSEK